jgi:hypothetical protein
VFEYEVHHNTLGTGLIEHTKAQRMFGDLQRNFGHAGLEIAKFFGQNIDLVRDNVAQLCDAVNNSVKGTTDDRFWISTVAIDLLGARIGNRLGLTSIGLDRLEPFLLDTLLKQRGDRKASSSNLANPETVLRHLTNFITDHADEILITDVVHNAGKRPTNFHPVPTHFPQRNKVSVRGGKQANVLILSMKALGAWSKKTSGLNRSQIEHAIRETLPSARLGTKTDLGHGTSYTMPREDTVWLDLNQLPGFYEFN